MGKEQELLEAARSGNVLLIEKILNQKNKWSIPLPFTQQLTTTLQKRVHPNCQDTNGETPLHHAALNGHRDVVELLLKLQASANIPDQRGCYPLHLAAWCGNADICRILLCHGPSIAKVNAQNLEGDTALHSAAQYGHIAVVSILLQHQADAQLVNRKSETALDLAVNYGRLETVHLLLKALCGRNTGGACLPGKSPLHLAARNGQKAIVAALLDACFDINRKTEEGSALHEAALYGRTEVVRLLIERGIDLEITDSDQRTALDIVREQKTQTATEIAKLITDEENHLRAEAEHNSEPTYDQLPVPRSVAIPSGSAGSGSRDSVTSHDSSCVFNFSPPEESIYDRPPALLRAVIPSVDQLSGSSLSLSEEPAVPGTPKKPPRRKAPLSVMVKGDSLEKKEPVMVALGPQKTTDSVNPSQNVTPLSVITEPADTSCIQQSTRSQGKDNNNDVPVAAGMATVDNAVESLPSKGGAESNKVHNHTVDNVKHGVNNNNNVNNNDDSSVGHGVQMREGALESKNGVLKNGSHGARPITVAANVRPPQLNLASKRSTCTVVPLSPTNYEQPPTPEHPPPSPMTAILGIQEKINPKDRRRSRDMETITEIEFLGGASSSAMSAGQCTAETVGTTHQPADSAPSSTTLPQDGASVAVKAENDCHLPSSDTNPFVGLMKGSNVGGQCSASGLRKAKSQRSETRSPALGTSGHINKRKSMPCPKTSYSMVVDHLEQQPDPCADKAVSPQCARSEGGRNPSTSACRGDRSQSVMCVDETEEWAKIEDIISSIGGGWHTELLKEFDQRMGSSFVADKELNILSVGDWLTQLGLPQYENTLIANGYDHIDFMGPNVLDEADLVEIGIKQQDHRSAILQASSRLVPVPPTNHKSLKDWLDSLHLMEYMDSFVRHDFTDVDRMRQVWEVELTTILNVTRLGHRKRILASLKPISGDNEVRQSQDKSLNVAQSLETDAAAVPAVDKEITEPKSPTQQWCHRPESLIKGCCNYISQYLGSTLVTELEGTESTKASISHLKKSTINITKIPSIILSVSYKGVKFIDANSKKVICEHEIDNIFCACQDGDDLTVFAYITRDLTADKEKHYCHVFRVDSTDMATEVILTLGEAFEVAYQIAMRENSQSAAGGAAGGSQECSASIAVTTGHATTYHPSGSYSTAI